MIDVELRQDVALGLRVLEILSEIVRRLLQGKLFKSVRGIESCPAVVSIRCFKVSSRTRTHAKQRNLFC